MASTRSSNLATVPLEDSIIPPSGVDKYGVALSSPERQMSPEQNQQDHHEAHTEGQPPHDLDIDVAGEYMFSTRKPKTYDVAMNDTVMKLMGNTVEEEEEERSIHCRDIFNDIIKEEETPSPPPKQEGPGMFDTLKNTFSNARNTILGSPDEERIPINKNIAACENGVPAPGLGTPTRGSSVTNSVRSFFSGGSASAASQEYLRNNADPEEADNMRENSMQNTEDSGEGDANGGPFGVFRLWSTPEEASYATRGFNLWSRRSKMLLVFMAALLIAIVVLASVLLTSGDDGGSDPTWEVQTEARSVPERPNPATPPRFTEVVEESDTEFWTTERVTELLKEVTSDFILDDPKSPQGKALNWILGDVGETQGMPSHRVVQRYILATLYYSTTTASQKWIEDDQWLSDSHECTWFGVMCGGDGSREFEPIDGRELPPFLNYSITYINLNSNNLHGTISSEIGKLENLGQLHLHDNSLTGSIPVSLAQLSHLHTLFLDKNFLNGEIPGGIDDIHSLVNLDLSSNSFTGAIPDLEHLTNLVYLRLDNNNLSGQFPKSLERLINVAVLTMGNNGIEGELPVALEEHQKLAILHLHENNLHGTIPEFKSPVLEEIHLDNNAFSGSIPFIVESGKTPILRELRLERNNLSGSIPLHLGDMWSLEKLWLDHNELTGAIPHELGRLENLRSMSLLQNRLAGTVPGPVCLLRSKYQLASFQATCDGSNPDLECSCCTRCTYS